MPAPPPAASDAPPAAAEDNADAANDNAAGGGSRRSLRARPQHVSYRDDELAWEALFNQESDDDGGSGDDDGRGGGNGEQRPKGKRGRPPKNQGERVGPVETVLGPSGRQVSSGIWEGETEKGEDAIPRLRVQMAVEVRGFFSSSVDGGACRRRRRQPLPLRSSRWARRLHSLDLAMLSTRRAQESARHGRGVGSSRVMKRARGFETDGERESPGLRGDA